MIWLFLLFPSLFLQETKSFDCKSEKCNSTASRIQSLLNKTVNPCDNFYEFACGGWNQFSPRPRGKGNWDQMERRSEQIHNYSKSLLEAEERIETPKSFHKAQIVYRDCMNNSVNKQNDTKSIQDLLISVGLTPYPPNVSSAHFSLQFTLARAKRLGIDLLFNLNIENTGSGDWIIMEINTFPIDDKIFKFRGNTRKLFEDTIGVLSPSTNVTIFYNEIVNLTNAHMKIETRNRYNHDFEILRSLDVWKKNYWRSKHEWTEYWKTLFKNTSLESFLEDKWIDIKQHSSVIELTTLLDKTEPLIIERYIWWSVFTQIASRSSVFGDLFLSQRQKVESRSTPYRLCSEYTNKYFGFALTNVYVKKHFDISLISKISDMVSNLKVQFTNNINQTKWMDPNTINNLLENFESLQIAVGYPEWVLDNEKLDEYYAQKKVIEGDFIKTRFALKEAETLKSLENIVNGTFPYVWKESPLRENAYFVNSHNTVEVPVGMIAPPYFDNGVEAIDYGSLGSIIAHEIMLEFYQEKIYKYMESLETMMNYTQLRRAFVNQYDSINITELPGINFNAWMSLDENLADNAGLQIAYEAYMTKLRSITPTKQHSNEFTAQQLFFVSFAQTWCGDSSLEDLESQLWKIGPFPNKYRVNAALANSQEFADVWECPQGSPMNPETKIRIL